MATTHGMAAAILAALLSCFATQGQAAPLNRAPRAVAGWPAETTQGYCTPWGGTGGDLCRDKTNARTESCSNVDTSFYLLGTCLEQCAAALCAEDSRCVGYTKRLSDGRIKLKSKATGVQRSTGHSCHRKPAPPTPPPAPPPTRRPSAPTNYPTYPTKSPTKYPTTKYPTKSPTKYPTQPPPTKAPTERCELPQFSFGNAPGSDPDKKRGKRTASSGGRSACVRTVGRSDALFTTDDLVHGTGGVHEVAVDILAAAKGGRGGLVLAGAGFFTGKLLGEVIPERPDPQIAALESQADCFAEEIGALWQSLKLVTRQISQLDQELTQDIAELETLDIFTKMRDISSMFTHEFIKPLSRCVAVTDQEACEARDGGVGCQWAISQEVCGDLAQYIGVGGLGTTLTSRAASFKVNMVASVTAFERIRDMIGDKTNDEMDTREFHWGALHEHGYSYDSDDYHEAKATKRYGHLKLMRPGSGKIGSNFDHTRDIIGFLIALCTQATEAMKLLHSAMIARADVSGLDDDHLRHFKDYFREENERVFYDEVLDTLLHIKKVLAEDEAVVGRTLRSDLFRDKMVCMNPTAINHRALMDLQKYGRTEYGRTEPESYWMDRAWESPAWCNPAPDAGADRVLSISPCPDYAPDCNKHRGQPTAVVGDACVTPCENDVTPEDGGIAARFCYTDRDNVTETWGWCSSEDGSRRVADLDRKTGASRDLRAHNFVGRWLSHGESKPLFEDCCGEDTMGRQDERYIARLAEYCDLCVDWEAIEAVSSKEFNGNLPQSSESELNPSVAQWWAHAQHDFFTKDGCKKPRETIWCSTEGNPRGHDGLGDATSDLWKIDDGSPPVWVTDMFLPHHTILDQEPAAGEGDVPSGAPNLGLSRNQLWKWSDGQRDRFGARIDPLTVELALLDTVIASVRDLMPGDRE